MCGSGIIVLVYVFVSVRVFSCVSCNGIKGKGA